MRFWLCIDFWKSLQLLSMHMSCWLHARNCLFWFSKLILLTLTLLNFGLSDRFGLFGFSLCDFIYNCSDFWIWNLILFLIDSTCNGSLIPVEWFPFWLFYCSDTRFFIYLILSFDSTFETLPMFSFWCYMSPITTEEGLAYSFSLFRDRLDLIILLLIGIWSS